MSDDVTRCSGEGCPLRARCARARLRAYARYDAFGSPPYDPRTSACDAFVDVRTLYPTDAMVRDRAYHRWQAAGRPEGTADRDWHEAREEWERRVRDSLYEADDEASEPGAG